jgi:glutaredoxin
VTYDEVNIWDDPEAAAFVRSVANGNETVPTVVIGGVAHVNPPPQLIIDSVQ